MIDKATVDRILDAVRIEEVIGDFVSLKRHGSSYVGLCPFHQDKNPSMSVSTTKGIFKCFSCGKAGNAVSFVMEHEHLTYPEALKYLAAKYHIEVNEKEESPEDIARRMKYDSLIVVSDFAQKFYSDVLWNNEYGRAVGLSYFHERQFTDETIRIFGLGYAHNRPLTLASEALKAGYKKEYLVDSGLCIERENGELADRFFDRVMFPIYSLSGRVIAFGGRTLRNDKTVAKYVNSPQTEIYDKSNSLYGIFQAKNAIGKQDNCILVEGYADVISMHQSGIENVVASSGTSLTIGQIRLIKRFTSNVTLIYDGDAAGIKAALRGTDLILEEGMNVKVVLLPPEDDPDSYAKAHTRDEIEDYIKENASDFITFKCNVLAKDMDSDPLQKARLINDIIKTISVIPDPIVRNVYVEMVAERFSQKSDSIFQKIGELRKKRAVEKKREAGYRNGDVPKQAGGFLTQQADVRPVPDEDYEPVFDASTVDMGDESESQIVPVEKADPGYAITNPFLAFQERELIYFLLKFGGYTMEYREVYGEETRPPMRVDAFIRDSLSYDGLVLENRLYREMFDEYFQYYDTITEGSVEARQEKLMRHFTTHENQAFVQQCLDLFFDKDRINVKSFIESLEPESSKLATVVPKSMLIYKARITEQQCIETTKQIAAAQHSGDEENVKMLTKRLQMLNQVKIAFSKELNRL